MKSKSDAKSKKNREHELRNQVLFAIGLSESEAPLGDEEVGILEATPDNIDEIADIFASERELAKESVDGISRVIEELKRKQAKIKDRQESAESHFRELCSKAGVELSTQVVGKAYKVTEQLNPLSVDLEDGEETKVDPAAVEVTVTSSVRIKFFVTDEGGREPEFGSVEPYGIAEIESEVSRVFGECEFPSPNLAKLFRGSKLKGGGMLQVWMAEPEISSSARLRKKELGELYTQSLVKKRPLKIKGVAFFRKTRLTVN